MLAQFHARKPAPPLAARGMWLRLGVGADAFGSALGDAVVGAIQRGDQQKAATQSQTNGANSSTQGSQNDEAAIKQMRVDAYKQKGYSEADAIDRVNQGYRLTSEGERNFEDGEGYGNDVGGKNFAANGSSTKLIRYVGDGTSGPEKFLEGVGNAIGGFVKDKWLTLRAQVNPGDQEAQDYVQQKMLTDARIDAGDPEAVAQGVNRIAAGTVRLRNGDPYTWGQVSGGLAVAGASLYLSDRAISFGSTFEAPTLDIDFGFRSSPSASRSTVSDSMLGDNFSLDNYGPVKLYEPTQGSPIDYVHAIGADYSKAGKPTGGHSLVNGDVRIVPGTESVPDVADVYKATVKMPDPKQPGQWITKTSNNSTNTMFPKSWDADRIKVEVDGAWNSSNKIVTGDKWTSVTPSGVKVEGWIAPKATVYPIYQTPKKTK